MSGRYPILLRKRALNALKWAERAYNDGDYDTAVREAEYAVQLYIKSIIYRILGEEIRGHNIRELLGVLVSALIEESFGTEANELIDYIRKHRRELAELSEAHTRAVYGLVEFGRRESGILLKIAKDILSVLKDLEVKIFGEKV
ncbi:MAG: HEPN domain-containing protein [Thermoprotei archaeon]|nr:HEPN domain-containing protein [Thermoprotei archaeon]